MKGFLIDTDVISETARPRPSAAVLAWLTELDEVQISSVSVFELARGISRLHEGRRRRFLEAWFEELLAQATSVLTFDETTARVAAQIEHEARRQGRVVESRDLFIVATARANGLKIATGNERHVAGLGVAVHNPFNR